MHRKFDVPFFCNWYYFLAKVLKRLPKFLFADWSILRERRILHQGVIKTGYHGAAARNCVRASPHPIEVRHPFITPHWNAQSSHVFEQRTYGCDLFLTAWQTPFGII